MKILKRASIKGSAGLKHWPWGLDQLEGLEEKFVM